MTLVAAAATAAATDELFNSCTIFRSLISIDMKLIALKFN